MTVSYSEKEETLQNVMESYVPYKHIFHYFNLKSTREEIYCLNYVQWPDIHYWISQTTYIKST